MALTHISSLALLLLGIRLLYKNLEASEGPPATIIERVIEKLLSRHHICK